MPNLRGPWNLLILPRVDRGWTQGPPLLIWRKWQSGLDRGYHAKSALTWLFGRYYHPALVVYYYASYVLAVRVPATIQSQLLSVCRIDSLAGHSAVVRGGMLPRKKINRSSQLQSTCSSGF
jgi:hypothetical protein